ncbi:MAG: response regulator [Sandaracinaceae bacterium]|nr:response regulator [Sandaracinaceae bacterium]
MSEPSARLLVVDDNPIDRERVLRLLRSDYAWEEASTASDALARASTDTIDCVVLDYRLPDADGLGTLERLVARGMPVVMLTGQGDEHTAVEAMKCGAHDYLAKSALDGPTLRHSIQQAIEKAELQRRVERQRLELERRLAQLASQREELARKNELLREREAKLRVILHQLPVVAWTTDRALTCTSVVGTTDGTTLDEREARGRPIHELWREAEGSDDAGRVHRAALGGSNGTFQLESAGRTLKGRVEPLRDANDAIVGVIGVALDVTDTRLLEEQVRRSQKMEALGQLAGGVAHDFNNLLTAIVSFTELAQEQVPEGTEAREDLSQVLSAAHRGTDLVRKLLAFSRRPTAKAETVDLNRVVTDLVPMLRRLVGEKVEIAVELGAPAPTTRAETGSLEQVIVNLVVNARDASPRGGTVTVSTRTIALSHADPRVAHGSLAPGYYRVLAVRDDGPGIAPSVRERIFEPFFTTKPAGKGTGLGLSTCYGIARSAGGGIDVASAPGSGATFRVYLPAAPDEDAALAAEPRTAPQQGELVLLIEDDEQVRPLVTRLLRAAGCAVLAAASMEDALRIAEERGAEVRLVLSDLVMPDRGPEATERLHRLLPDAAVLYMSGYDRASLEGRALIGAGAPLLQKPFTSRELASAVRAALDARPRAAPREQG